MIPKNMIRKSSAERALALVAALGLLTFFALQQTADTPAVPPASDSLLVGPLAGTVHHAPAAEEGSGP